MSPYSFDYTLNSSKSADENKKRKGRPSITSMTIFPIHILANETSDMLRNRVDPSMIINPEAYQLLKTWMMWTSGSSILISMYIL